MFENLKKLCDNENDFDVVAAPTIVEIDNDGVVGGCENHLIPQVNNSSNPKEVLKFLSSASVCLDYASASGGRNLNDVRRRASGDEQRNIHVVEAKPFSSKFQPAYSVFVDLDYETIVVSVRGTATKGDAETNFTFESIPFHEGWAHRGFCQAAVWLHGQIWQTLVDLKQKHPRFPILLSGLSYGGAVCALFCLAARSDPRNSPLSCFAVTFGAPPCISGSTLIRHARAFVTSFVNRLDCVPFLNPGLLSDKSWSSILKSLVFGQPSSIEAKNGELLDATEIDDLCKSWTLLNEGEKRKSVVGSVSVSCSSNPSTRHLFVAGQVHRFALERADLASDRMEDNPFLSPDNYLLIPDKTLGDVWQLHFHVDCLKVASAPVPAILRRNALLHHRKQSYRQTLVALTRAYMQQRVPFGQN